MANHYIELPITPEEFLKLREQRMTLHAIAMKCYVSYGKLCTWMKEHDLTGKTPRADHVPAISKEKFIELKHSGMTDKEIAEVYGVCVDSIINWKHKHGLIQKRVNLLAGKKREDYFQLRHDGLNDMDVRAEWKCGYQTLRRWKKANGI